MVNELNSNSWWAIGVRRGDAEVDFCLHLYPNETMSLHIELSPEAQSQLEAQRRNSMASAVVISILVLALIGLILALVNLAISQPLKEPLRTYASGVVEEPTITERKMPTSNQQAPSPPSGARSAVIATDALSPVAVPVPEVDVPDPASSFGAGDDFGEGFDGNGANGSGNQGTIQGIPIILKNRCTPEARMSRLKENGGTPECEEAVVKALRWMKGRQQADGSWSDGSQPVAMTAMSLLAYLGHCETPVSEEFGESCLRAITYLIANAQKNGGPLTKSTADKHWPYEHAIATYALAEAYTFCKPLDLQIPNLKETVQKAGQMIIDKQHSSSGGWDYSYDQSGARGGDLSIVGWHVQALKACKHTGLDFAGLRKTMMSAEDYIEARSNDQGGFGYSGTTGLGGFGYDTLTGVGVLSLQMVGRASSREARAGLRYIVEKSKFDYNGEWCDLYAHYYESQACMNRGGKTWDHYNELFRDQLLNNQNADGSWKVPGGGQKPNAVAASFTSNEHYRTCLCTLMLEVYYRFLPGTSSK